MPVKSLTSAKQRLAPLLSADERARLAQMMLEDVCAALAQVRRRPAIALVTADAAAQALARQHGFEVIADKDEGGETAAIAMATEVCSEGGAEWSLVIPGDAPLVTATEIERVLAAMPPRGAVLAPDWKWRGTNAALRRPADLFPLRFGDDSFFPHLRGAAATGQPAIVLDLPGVAVDVDRAEDVEALLARSLTSRAQRLLQTWDVAARIAKAQLAVSS